MTRPPFAWLAGLALLIACLAVLLSGPPVQAASDDGGGDTSAEEARQPADEVEDQGSGQGGRSEVATETIPSDTQASAPNGDLPERFLRGQVLDEKYEPIADAYVLTGQEPEPVMTDADGGFEIRLVEDFGPSNGRSVIAWKPGMSVASKWVRQLDDNLLILKPDEGKEITVVDAESNLPLEGVQLTLMVEIQADTSGGFFELRNFQPLPTDPLMTDANGKVTVPDPEASDTYTMEVRKEGYVMRYLDQWDVRRRDQVRLAKPEPLRMRFVTKDGVPHAGARLCFPWYRKIVTLDDDGWGDLPPEAKWGFWSVQLRSETTQWVWSEVDGSLIQNGGELATDWRPRQGKLYVQGDEKPDVFEVGTSAAWEAWGWQEYLPSPQWNQKAIEWVQVAEDGSFALESGWQGESTYLHVRRVGSEGVLLSQKLLGDGTVELTLSAAAQVAIEVRCPRPELLEGASLRFSGHETDHEQTITLASGRAELRLPADTYYTRLTLANSSVEFPLEQFTVIGLDMDYVFHFEGIRSLTGKLTAGGQPIFPCRIDVRGQNGFSTRVETRPDGSWAIDHVPKEQMRLHVRPEDQWITPVEGAYLWAPAALDHFEHDFETATLLLSIGSYPMNRAEDLRVSRRARTGTPSCSPITGERQRLSSASPEMPDFSGGPVELMVTPGRLRFSTDRVGVPLTDLEVQLSAGDVRSVRLDTLPTCEARVVLAGGFQQSVWGSVSWEPVDVPGLLDYPEFEVQSSRRSSVGGQVGNGSHLLPGSWRLRVRAPFWSNEVRGQVGVGSIDEVVEVSEAREDFRIELDRDGRIYLADNDS